MTEGRPGGRSMALREPQVQLTVLADAEQLVTARAAPIKNAVPRFAIIGALTSVKSGCLACNERSRHLNAPEQWSLSNSLLNIG